MATSTNFTKVLDYAIKSQPIKVISLGFESDTYRLSRAGWSLSVEEDIRMNGAMLAMRHDRLRMFSISKPLRVEYFLMRDPYLMAEMLSHICFEMEGFFPDIHALKVTGVNFNNFKPIDAEPEICRQEIKSIQDFAIFKTIDKAKEIIVEPETVAELMAEILKRQAPKQEEIREKLRKQRRYESIESMKFDEIRPPTDIHAQIITLAA